MSEHESILYTLKGTANPLLFEWDNKTVLVASSGSNCGTTISQGKRRNEVIFKQKTRD